jgi:proteasome accessory factor BC
VTGELEDGAVVVERGFASMRYLVRDVLKEAGDAVVLEPEEGRTAVREAAEAIRAQAAAPAAAR